MQGGPIRQYSMTGALQSRCDIPLFIASDAEWGVGMRLDSVFSYPKAMQLGAIRDYRIIEEIGAEIGRQCDMLGINVNFAPVLDVNTNSKNPVINFRSFGENPQKVANMGYAFIRGMQKNGVLAVGKHFPGHGDTQTDSHFNLPLV